ncbi:MAG: septum formation initiator family protein [Clostridia bacterium]|nr:septum formation initiator family protein [Clostridia bacterium]
MIITLVSVQIQLNDLKEERDQLQSRIDETKESIEALQNRLDTPFDEEYIIALAKEKLGYCLPDEIIFYNDLITE